MSARTPDGSPRIVVTGIGWVTPLGHDIETVWKRLLNAESGMAPTTRFDARTFPTTFAAEVRDYDVTRFVKDPKVHATAGLNSQFALGAASQAWKQAGFDAAPPRDPRRDQDRNRITAWPRGRDTSARRGPPRQP
jgi:3-oxoacyl-[acyl-carrier-protein] synthase II